MANSATASDPVPSSSVPKSPNLSSATQGNASVKKKPRSKKLLLGATVFLLISACVITGTGLVVVPRLLGRGSRPSDPFENLDQSQQRDFLRLDSCDALTAQLKTWESEVKEKSRSYNLGNQTPTMAPSREGGDTANDVSGRPGYFTNTNVQVEGIDEGDIVKTDGKRLFAINTTAAKITISEVFPAASAVKKADLNFTDESPQQLLLAGNKLIVLANNFHNFPMPYTVEPGAGGVIEDTMLEGSAGSGSGGAAESQIAESKPAESKAAESGVATMPSEPTVAPDTIMQDRAILPRNSNLTVIYIYDVSDLANPKQLRKIELQGTMVTSRLRDGYLYLVSNNYASDLDNPIPLYRDSAVGTKFMPSCDCKDVVILDKDNYYAQFSSVLALNLDGEQASSSSKPEIYNFVGNTGTVYMGYDSLYLASTNYNYVNGSASTALTKVGYSRDSLKFVGLRKFHGTLLNQFALDEFDGNLRLAGTLGDNWQTSTENYLLTFDKDLKPLGQVRDLAKGERIYSVRFYGELGVVVTFKQVDPLFVFDLKDAAAPKLKGELKIPGFSDYLHFIDANTVLGFGKDASTSGTVQGLKLATFDISNLSKPQELSKVLIGDQGSDSQALHDHKAFVFDSKHNLVILPIMEAKINPTQCKGTERRFCYGQPAYQGSYVFKFDSTNKKLGLQGRVTNYNARNTVEGYQPPSSTGPYRESIQSQGQLSVQRNLVIEDNLVTVSNLQLGIYELGNLKQVKSLTLHDPNKKPDSIIIQ